MNAHALEHGAFSVTEQGIRALHPDAEHVGTPFVVLGRLGAPEGHLGRRVDQDRWLGVVWAAMLRDGGGAGMFIACRASAFFALPEGDLPEEHRTQLLAGAERYMASRNEGGRLIRNQDDLRDALRGQ